MHINKIVKGGIRYIFSKRYRFFFNAAHGLYDGMQDEEYLKRLFYAILGKRLNLNSPKTFNEKLQWIKLYDRNQKYVFMVDKYLVREYIADVIGEKYLIPLLGVWKSSSDINFDELPNKFVLKCNHNSGSGMCICKDKEKLDIAETIKKLEIGMNQNYFLWGREWPYKNVSRRIIAEKFMENADGSPINDYKFQCFNGEVDHIFVCEGRFSDEGVQYYYFSKNWEYLPYSKNEGNQNENIEILRPSKLDEMIYIAEKLSQGCPEMRVDLYEIQGKVYFGELTFFTESGFDNTITEEADAIIGSRFILPK